MNVPTSELPLKDIHLPDSISWWPLAAGWWILLCIALAFFVLAFVFIRRYFKPSLKKDASKELHAIEQLFQRTQNATQCVADLSILLRRVVLSQKHQVPTAGVTGSAWLKLLDQALGTSEFSQGPGQILLVGPYQPAVEKDEIDQLIKLCHKWVNHL